MCTQCIVMPAHAMHPCPMEQSLFNGKRHGKLTHRSSNKRKADRHENFGAESQELNLKYRKLSGTNAEGKPFATIEPMRLEAAGNQIKIEQDLYSDEKDKLHYSLLRSSLLANSEIKMEKPTSSGMRFVNPKKELIVKHNMDMDSSQMKYNKSAIQEPRTIPSSDIKNEIISLVHNMIKKEDSDCSNNSNDMFGKKECNGMSNNKPMSNMEFWKYLLTLQVLMQQASVQLKNMVTKPVEELLSHSLKLVDLKTELEPHLNLLEDSLRVILNVLPHIEYVEIGSPDNTFKVSQQAWEKAYSKTTIKDSALAFLECDLFIPKPVKLSSTAGRSSNSAINGALKPIDSRILNALYYTLADRKRMPNIQRTQDNYLASPYFLTAKEQKLVRETLAQYFNQLRQKEKRKAQMNH